MIEDGTRMGDRKWINRKKRSNRERKSKDECKTLRGGRRKRWRRNTVLEGIQRRKEKPRCRNKSVVVEAFGQTQSARSYSG